MMYSKSVSEYFRNKKGGGLQTNGKLNAANFSNQEVELNEINSSIKIKPIKIMVKKKSKFNDFRKKLPNFLKFLKSKDEHYIFFGLNPRTGIYEYVCYVNQDFSQLNTTGSPIICKKREENGRIVELTHHQFLEIDIQELSILVYNILLIRKKNKDFLNEEFFRYLLDFVLPIILNTEIHNENYMYIVGEIRKILPNPDLSERNNNVNNNPVLPRRR